MKSTRRVVWRWWRIRFWGCLRPFRLTGCVTRFDLCRFDGIEAENPVHAQERPRPAGRVSAGPRRGREGALIGASDAHFGDLAKSVTLFEGQGSADVRRALEERTTVPAMGRVRHPRPSLRAHTCRTSTEVCSACPSCGPALFGGSGEKA